MEEIKTTPEESLELPMINENELDQTILKPGKKMGMKSILSMLTAAVRGGDMTTRQAAQIRSEFGLSKRYFTKTKRNKDAARAARKRARLSRRANRGLGKGQKRTGGSLRLRAKT